MSQIEFFHQCPEIPGGVVDCAAHLMGIVTFTFEDGSAPLRVFVSDGAPQKSSPLRAPSPSTGSSAISAATRSCRATAPS